VLEVVNGADGISDIEGKVARVAAREWSRGAASDIDGQTERSKWAGAHESIGKRTSFNPVDGTEHEPAAERDKTSIQTH
jgi:hypothetical protein